MIHIAVSVVPLLVDLRRNCDVSFHRCKTQLAN